MEVGDTMKRTAYAFGRWTNGTWQIFCPTCWTNVHGNREADADLLDGNGDSVVCIVCLTVMS